MVVAVTTPFVIVAVAVAVDPIPVTVLLPSGRKLVGNPTEKGLEIFTLTVPVCPDPPLPIVSALIVPAADTVAVIAAATGSPEVLTSNASILIGLPTS